LTQALADLDVALKKVPEERLQSVATEFNLKSPEELFEQIGLGERLAPLVARRLAAVRCGGSRSRDRAVARLGRSQSRARKAWS
jgi:(p)ppGpp synthase/HD superfamily hydrolase